MTEPIEPAGPPEPPPAAEEAPPAEAGRLPVEVEADEAALAPEQNGELAASGPAPEALREIANAFRMNAEALHTLKEMQLDLSRSIQRGDRSELMLQSTRALNDTFRNLSTVQRELLERLDGRGAGGRGPLIPLMILGLLIVVVAGVYLILDAVQSSAPKQPAIDMAELHQRERDSWKEGRREGAMHSEREIRRLEEALDASTTRARELEKNLEEKLESLGELDRLKRAAELERDQFAGQVRKAQGEMLAKQALEEEVASLRTQIGAANRETLDLQIDLDRERRMASHLRDRMADYGMDIPEADPPYRGPVPTPPAVGSDTPTAEPAPAEGVEAPKPVNLLNPRHRRENESDAPPAPVPDPAATTPAPARASGGLPPPVLKRRSAFDRNPGEIGRVRTMLNQLLSASSGPQGESWSVTRIDGLAQDRLGGVIVLHYDAAGRLIEGIEAREMRITVDKERRTVEFALQDGVQVRQNRRTPLPAAGRTVQVAKGDASRLWAGAGLTMIRKK